MSVRRIMGTEVEYGISVQGQPAANPMVASSQVVNAYATLDHQGAPGPVGLRGGVAAARRAWLRHVASGGRPQPAHRRGPRPGQRDPHQRRPALRRPRAPGVLHARGDLAAGHRAVGQGGGADHARRLPSGRAGARGDPDRALQEQHRQQGRVVRRPRELPDAALHAVRRDRAPPHAVLRLPPGRVRCRAGGDRPGRARARLPAQPARRLLRGRGRAGDHPQAADHQHPGRAARGPREVPSPARDPGRRQPRRGLDVPQGRHDRPGAGHDRGRLPDPRPHRRRAGRVTARGLPRPDAAAPAHAARRPHADGGAAPDGVPRPGPQVRRRPARQRRRRADP